MWNDSTPISKDNIIDNNNRTNFLISDIHHLYCIQKSFNPDQRSKSQWKKVDLRSVTGLYFSREIQRGGLSLLFWKTQKIHFDVALGVVQALKCEKQAAADAQQVTGGNGMTCSNVSATSRLAIPLDGNLVAYKFIGSNSSYSPPDGVF